MGPVHSRGMLGGPSLGLTEVWIPSTKWLMRTKIYSFKQQRPPITMQSLTDDGFWDDMDLCIPFDDRLLLPNSPSLIHSGPYKICTGSEESALMLDGKIEQTWHPTPKARYIGSSIEPDQKIVSLLSKGFRSCSKELDFNCRIARITELHGGFECSGSVNGLLLKGANMPIDEMRFSLANFPAFLGVKVKSVDENTGCRYSHDSIIVNGSGWILRIDQRYKAGYCLSEVAAKGGYISTHACSLKRSDGEHFEYSTALCMITCLTYFFGFLAGRWCGPVLPIGFSNNSSRWEIYGSYQISPTPKGSSWFPSHHTLDIAGLLSGFLALWDSEAWQDPLRQAIHWIVAANTSQNAVETSMVAAFVPLEMLCWLILVETKNKFSVKEFKKIQADAKLSELLAVCRISNSLPSYFESLRDAFDEQENLAAPTALVEIRNAITHPRRTKRIFLGKVSRLARYQAKELCLELVELVLLESMGYLGRYRRRAFGGWSGEEYASVPWSNGSKELGV